MTSSDERGSLLSAQETTSGGQQETAAESTLTSTQHDSKREETKEDIVKRMFGDKKAQGMNVGRMTLWSIKNTKIRFLWILLTEIGYSEYSKTIHV